MSILNVEHLTHGFGDRAIFNDVSFRLLAGEHIGLIGANGEGKSTFMNIITGKQMPDEGKIEWAKNCHVGYMDQHAVLTKGMTIRSVLKSAFDYLFDLEKRLNEAYLEMGEADEESLAKLMEETGTIQDLLTMHDFYMIDSKVEEVAAALGLSDIGLDNDVTELSGGQRTKVLLAKLLLEKPDILLLDEPTNYLDREHIAWLTRYLQEYENAFILISHDIPFLNSVINIIYHMNNQELKRYVGDYNNFLEAGISGKVILEAKDLVIGYDSPLSKPMNLYMERGQKVVIEGANGIGKTTLLKSIMGLIPPLSGEVRLGDSQELGYFEQEMSGNGNNTCINEIWEEFPGFSQYEVRSALSKCGLTTKHIESMVKVLSGGEQAKVRLCKLINRKSNILVLDEPTNHLDVDAKDELKRALIAYKGSIIMVCHEPEFYEGLASDVWDLSKWTTKLL